MSAGLVLLLLAMLAVFAVGLTTIGVFLYNVAREWVPVLLHEAEAIARDERPDGEEDAYVIDVESRLETARSRVRQRAASAAETPAQARFRQWQQTGAAPW